MLSPDIRAVPASGAALKRSLWALLRAMGVALVATQFAASAWGQVGTERDRRFELLDSDTALPSHLSAVDLDRPTPAADCNRNAVHDGLDVLGIVARGPVPVGARPRAVTAADLDGDRRSDLVVINPGAGTATLLWQKSSRRFEAGATIDVGAEPSCVAAGDLDGDGDLDLAIGHVDTLATYVTVLWNDGARTFRRQDLQISSDTLLAAAPRCVAIGDLDGDGRPDLVATSGAATGSKKLTWFAGLGGGRFADPVHKMLPLSSPTGLALADLNGDGRLDMAVSDPGTPRLVVVHNSGAGVAFADWWHTSYNDTPGASRTVRAADLDGDGDIDLVVSSGSRGEVTVLLNDSRAGATRHFASGTRYPAGTSEGAFDLADLDGDGLVDIVVPDTRRNRLAWLRNAGGGRFEAATWMPVGDSPAAVWAGNLDSDRHAEIAVTHEGSGELWVLHMAAQPVAPDCNRNGTPDVCDIAAGRSLDIDHDGTPDECRRPHPRAPRRSPPR